MTDVVVPVSLEQALSGTLGSMAYQWWTASRGWLDRDPFKNLSDIISLTHVSVVEGEDVPRRFFFVGADSPAADIFGKDWAASACETEFLPDRNGEAICNPAYLTARLEHRPIAHFCFVDFNNGEMVTELQYNRLLLPCRIRSGAPLVLCVSDLLHKRSYN